MSPDPFVLKRGLDLPIAGAPVQSISRAPEVSHVALVADDYVGMKPTMVVAEGEFVRRGQLLFTDKHLPAIRYTAPASGNVVQINRGAKRVFQSLVIQVADDEAEEFTRFDPDDLLRLDGETVVDQLVQSGLWTALRTRPFSKVPDPESMPAALFVTAIDTQPLAPNPEVILAEAGSEFLWGLDVLRHLTRGKVYLCKAANARIPEPQNDFVTVAEFVGPHPAGLPGIHIHYLAPVSDKRQVWYIGYQDVIAAGKLFVHGTVSVDRVISLAGPCIKNPRLIRTQLGAAIDELVAGELDDGSHRVISGSVLSGRTAHGVFAYLGRYHHQVSVIAEATQREFLGWQTPGFGKFSESRAFASAFAGRNRRFALTTSLEGSRRAMVPIGSYERVMPMDLLFTYLLRALIVGDAEQARRLGCLELDEDDVALCSYVCPGKYEYGPLLRGILTDIEKDG